MKKDLERFKDKMTPEEERLVWSKMKDSLRAEKTGRTSWFPRLWLNRVVYAGAAAAVALVIWQTGLLSPDHAAKDQMAAKDRERAAEVSTEPGEAMIGAENRSASEAIAAQDEPGGRGAADAPSVDAEEATAPDEASGETAGELFAEDAAEAVRAQADAARETAMDEGEAAYEQAPQESDLAAGAVGQAEEERIDRGVMRPVPPEARVYEEEKGKAAEADVVRAERMPLTREYEGEEGEPYEPPAKDEGVGGAVDERGETLLTGTAEEGAALPEGARLTSQAKSGERSKVKDAGHIVGLIKDKNGDPVAYATVTIKGTRYGAVTDDAGRFEIRNVPAGTYTLIVSAGDLAELKLQGIVVEKGKTYDLKTVELDIEGRALGEAEEANGGLYFGHRQDAPAEIVKKLTDKAQPMVLSELARRDKRGGRGGYPSLTGGSRPVNDELADDMFFQSYGTNPFIDADEDALSTFGLDVDTGSYTISRRYIKEGHLPPPDAVRVEEFLNFFPKDYDPPERGDFAIHVDGMPSPFAHVKDGNYYLLRIGIRGRVVDERNRKPAQVVLVIDTSGSMGMGNRLPLLKSAMEVLLDELRYDDEIGIVEFGSQAREVLPLTPIGEGERDIYRAIRSLQEGGSTNAEQGLKLGYKMMRRHERRDHIHRIIFCSDGVANVGNTGWESILESVRRDSDDIQLTTIGFGMGNYNDILMEQLADAGDGQYAYVDNMREAKRVLRENLTGTLQTIAKDTKAQIEFYPNYVVKYRLLGYENRDVRDEDFRDDTIDAGEIGAGHEVTVLYEVKLQEKLHKGAMATVHLRYEDPESGRVREISEPVSPGFVTREFEDAPPEFVMDACVAEFAEILRHSYWAKDSSLEDVYDLLRGAEHRMTSRADVDELLDLIKKAMRIEDDDDGPRRRGWYEEEEE